MTDQLQHLRAAAERASIPIEVFVVPENHERIVGGMRLHYLDWGGPPDGRAVLFLHGGGLNAHTWDLVCLSLRQEYRCLALDLRGHGDSEWSPILDYSYVAHSRDILGFLDALDLVQPVLVGMSLGGLGALQFASEHSERLHALVIVDTGPSLQQSGTARIRQFFREEPELPSVEHFVERALEFNPRRNRELLRTSLLHNLRELPNGNWTWKYDRRYVGARPPEQAAAEHRALDERIHTIACPTLVVRGAQSDIFHVEDARRLVAKVSQARLVEVENAGHTVQGDNPKGLVLALDAFFGEVGA
jgi:esterase